MMSLNDLSSIPKNTSRLFPSLLWYHHLRFFFCPQSPYQRIQGCTFFYLIAAGVLLLLCNVISHSRTTKQNTRRCCLPNSTGNCYFKLFYEYWLRIGSKVVPCFFPCFRFVKLDSQQFVFTFVWDVCFESAGTQFSRSLQFFFSILQGTTASKTFL